MPAERPVLDRRRAGVLLHAPSLPSGCLDDAPRFLDFLANAGFSAWQLLPLGPSGASDSPYSLLSAFAGSGALIPSAQREAPISREALGRFAERERNWLRDYALFMTIRETHDRRPWWQWPAPLREREPRALLEFERAHPRAITGVMRTQLRFERAWQSLRVQAVAAGIQLIGDLPMYVMANSADAWANPELFRLDAEGRSSHLAGVPPDAFTDQGQCWDCPVYHWPALQAAGFSWWERRFRHEMRRFDLLRWDHFRGLVAGWEIPVPIDGSAPDPRSGQWRKVPGRALLAELSRRFRPLPVIAENLGVITPGVEQLRRDYGLPGMHVLQFAFDGLPDNPHLPERHEEQGVAYSGTHDNDTTLGWISTLDTATRHGVADTLGSSTRRLSEAVLDSVLSSPCRLAVLTMQDLLGLGSAARLNTPGVADGQWRWRFGWTQLEATTSAHWASRLARGDRQPA